MADDIKVKVGFDGTAAETGLGKLRKESESFGQQLTNRLAGAFAAMTLFDRGVAFATKTFEKFADVSDKAERAGISAEDFQRIGYAAELSGTSMEAAAKAMREIRNATADAAAGSKKAADSLIALGFTREQIAKGDIKATEVLLRLASAYKAAGSDAAKFGVATSILSTRSASEMMPMLATSQQELGAAMQRDVVSQDVADQMKAVADQAKIAAQELEMFTVSLIGAVMQLAGSINEVLGFYETRIKGKMEDAKTATGPEKARLEKEALALFEEHARNFRVASLGRTIDGVFMDKATVEGILNQKFGELFPPAMQRERQRQQAGIADAIVPPPAAVAQTLSVVASSLAQVGGGGGVYSTDLIDVASRTADATERTATAVEQLAGITPEEASPVSSE